MDNAVEHRWSHWKEAEDAKNEAEDSHGPGQAGVHQGDLRDMPLGA